MPYGSVRELPASVRTALPAEAQKTFLAIVNRALSQYEGDEQKAFSVAWAGLRRAGWKKQDGKWVKTEKASFHLDVAKADEDRRLVFGWAALSETSKGQLITDLQEDQIEISELENAAYDFVLHAREAGEMHEAGGKGTLVESFVSTPEKLEKLGLPPESVPRGWWVGFRLEPDVFAKVKDGTYGMFSIQGRALREAVS